MNRAKWGLVALIASGLIVTATAGAASGAPVQSKGQTSRAAPALIPGSIVGTYEIKNRYSGRCLDADTNTIGADGTIVQLWDCNGHSNLWNLRYEGTNDYSIQNVASGRYLDEDLNGHGADGTKVQLWDWTGEPNQMWPYGIVNPEHFASEFAGDLDADLHTIGYNGTRVQVWDAIPGNTNQQWTW